MINPNATATDVTFTYLLENEKPVVKTVTLGPIDAPHRPRGGQIQELANRSFGIAVECERADHGRACDVLRHARRRASGAADTNRPASRAPSTDWFLAEGATGAFFDTFVLLSNPQNTPAQVTVRYLLDNGDTVTVPKTIAANARLTINIETEDDARLRERGGVDGRSLPTCRSSPSVRCTGRGGDSRGAKATTASAWSRAGTRWGLAEGRVGGPLELPHVHPAGESAIDSRAK